MSEEDAGRRGREADLTVVQLTPGAANPDKRVTSLPLLRVRAFRIGLMGSLGVGLGILILGSLSSLGTVITYVGIALFLALGLDPVVTWLENRGVKRGLAVAIVFLTLLLILAGIIWAIVPTLVAQIQSFIGSLPRLIAQLSNREWVEDLSANFSGVVDVDAMLRSVGEFTSNPTNIMSVGGGVLAVGQGIASFITGVIIVLILTLYFVASLPSITRAFYQIVPGTAQVEVAGTTDEVTKSVGRFVLGQSALAAVNGVLSFVFLTIIGAPLPALLAFVAFLGSLVPLVGTITGSAIIVISCFFADPGLAVIAGIYYLVYMQVEAYLLSPRIMNKAVSVPGAIVVIAAIAGGTLGGVLGALVAIPTAASILIVLRRSVVPRLAAR